MLLPRVIAAVSALPAILGLAACGRGEAQPAASGASAGSPVVVELFQSQGCSSCPPADANLNMLAGRGDVLALSFAVTYWDQLGWKDSFASPAFTARQWDYARHGGRGEVATPQVIVDGGDPIVGSNARQLADVIVRRGPPRGGPAITPAPGGVRLTGGAGAGGEVWLVRYDPAERLVAIGAGENAGRRQAHRDVVRQLVRLGAWTGAPATYRLPAPSEPRLATALLVQAGRGGPVIAARRL